MRQEHNIGDGQSMKLPKYKVYRTQILMFVVFVFILIFQVMRLGDLPGMYMDSVMSDYASTRYIYQQNHSYSFFGMIDNLQLVGIFYHGNLTMLWTLFVNLITGTTSVLQYRIGTACWAIGIIVCLQYILSRAGVRNSISFLVIASMCWHPSFVTTIITQDYNYLPGTLFIFLQFIFLHKWYIEQEDRSLFVAAFFVGLAVYSYIIYFLYYIILFCVVFVLLKKKIFRNVFHYFFILAMGGFAGIYLYILSFYAMTVGENHLTITTQKIIFFVIAIALACCTILFYRLSLKTDYVKTKLFALFLAMMWVILSFGTQYVMKPVFRNQVIARSTGISGSSVSFGQRIFNVLHSASVVFRNLQRERDILGYSVSRFSFIWRDIYFALLVGYFIYWIYVLRKNKRKVSILVRCNLVIGMYQAMYLFLAFLFISGGINAGHTVTFYILSYLHIGLICADLFGFANNIILIEKLKLYVFSLIGISIFINFVNMGVLTSQIKRTGGHGYYSSQTTEFINVALKDQSEGKRIFYLIPEWGIWTEFVYLGGNTLPFYGALPNEDYLNVLLEEGYHEYVIPYFIEDREEEYLDWIDEVSESEVEKKNWYSLDGKKAFSTLHIHIE